MNMHADDVKASLTCSRVSKICSGIMKYPNFNNIFLLRIYMYPLLFPPNSNCQLKTEEFGSARIRPLVYIQCPATAVQNPWMSHGYSLVNKSSMCILMPGVSSKCECPWIPMYSLVLHKLSHGIPMDDIFSKFHSHALPMD